MPNAHNQTARPMVELSLAQVELIARANIQHCFLREPTSRHC